MIGQTIGGYRVIEQVGLGGMATIYKAYQPSMERYVALKVIPQHHAADPRFVERFIREARTIARLEHQNILPVYDFGEQDGITYLVMRYLDGGTLKDVLEQGRVSLADAQHITWQLCAALDYAHKEGVVHRDVKPANVMITAEGAVYLTDFGIAKVLESQDGLTATGAAIGTPAYMAPEQSLGHGVDSRTDIYATGIILYELVLGKPPYEADTPMAVALAHIHNPLPVPSQVDPYVTEEIEAVIIKALAKDPNDRYQSAGELARAFRQAVEQAGAYAAETTISGLVHEAMTVQSLRADEPVPPEEIAAPVKKPTVQQPSRRGFSLPAILGIGAVVVIAAVLGVLALLGVFSKEPGDASAYYDRFDNAVYDGSFDPALWSPVDISCNPGQMDGMLVFTLNDPNGSGCSIQAPPVSGAEMGSFELKAQVASDILEGEIGAVIDVGHDFENGTWRAVCGPHHFSDGTKQILMQVTDERLPVEQRTMFFQSLPAQLDTWYTIRLEVDPVTMAFTCYVDDERIGTYVADNRQELQASDFYRYIGTYSAGASAGMVLVDDVRFIAPEQVAVAPELPQPTPDASLYDDFNDLTYEGSYNDTLWVFQETDADERCDFTQQNGTLGITSELRNRSVGCNLLVNPSAFAPMGSELPSIEADIRIQNEVDGPIIDTILFSQTWEGDSLWQAQCMLAADGPEARVTMFAQDIRTPDEGPALIAEQRGLDYNTWYTLRLEVDPSTMTFTCVLDGEELASYTPENAGELRGYRFEQGIRGVWDPGAQATILIDKVRLITPESTSGASAPAPTPTLDLALYDDFNNTAFDGSLNPVLWAPGPNTNLCIQENGVLKLTHTPDMNDTCGIFINNSVLGTEVETVEAEMMVSSDLSGSGNLGTILKFWAGLEGGAWAVHCGLRAYQQTVLGTFYVQDQRVDEQLDDVLIPLDFDTWYTFRLAVDNDTMRISCSVNGQQIGDYTPDNAEDLKPAEWVRMIDVGGVDMQGTSFIDNFRLIRP